MANSQYSTIFSSSLRVNESLIIKFNGLNQNPLLSSLPPSSVTLYTLYDSLKGDTGDALGRISDIVGRIRFSACKSKPTTRPLLPLSHHHRRSASTIKTPSSFDILNFYRQSLRLESAVFDKSIITGRASPRSCKAG